MNEQKEERKKCWFFSYIIFSINLLLAGLVVLAIRHRDEQNLFSEAVSSDTDFAPVKESVLDAQNKISTDRENKLRDLNNEPKEIKQVDTITTTTTTTTSTTADPPKADTKTKSS